MILDVKDSIQKTIDSIPDEYRDRVIISIPSGTYTERVEIKRSNVMLVGDEKGETVISLGHYAEELLQDGTKRGTFGSYTMYIEGNDVTLKNITVKNTAAPRQLVKQAVALYAAGDNFLADHCKFYGYQDTLFTGPLPEKEAIPGGFKGPGFDRERLQTTQFYQNCYICGDIDFIFGSASAFFYKCDIEVTCHETSHLNNASCYGYITAASTYRDREYGFVFKECRIYGCLPEQSVYLGRPWREYAKTVFINCYMGALIKEEGFHDWNKHEARKTVFYGEYSSKGPGASNKRDDFVKQLTNTEITKIDIDTFEEWKGVTKGESLKD